MHDEYITPGRRHGDSWREERKRLGLRFRLLCHRGELGRLLGLDDWEETTDNALLDEGERDILNIYFRNTTGPANFFMGLHSGTLAETHTLANVVEPAQAGYARQQIARSTAGWNAPSLDAGDYKVTQAAASSFNAAATWTPVSEIFLASTSAGAVGSVILSAPLSTLRSLVSGDRLDVTLSMKLQ